MAVLFSAILLIPRIRRLRRRVWAWTVVRCLGAGTGGALVWRFVRAGAATRLADGAAGQTAGIKSLLFGIALMAFAALVKARPEKQSLDQLARKLGALVVVNGGCFLPPNGTKSVAEVSVFVSLARLLVLTSKRQQVAEIPLAGVRHLSAHPAGSDRLSATSSANDRSHPPAAWDLEIAWESSEPLEACFRYEGFFAEHLARVAEETIRSVWKKALPVLP
ncbi:MAG TPA: hypothetical protein VI455_12540 [Terriglobia bacterium]